MRIFGPASLAVPVHGKYSATQGASLDVVGNAPSCMDEAAFRELYNEVAPKLRAYIRRACGDVALADDLLQEAFYRFLRANLPPLEQWQRKAYLFRTASTLLTDHWRHLARERRWRPEGFFGQSEPGEESNYESEAMLLFRRLKPREQTLLWLAYVEGFNHREIASAMQLSEKSVRVLLFRARGKFGDALRKEGLAHLYGGLKP
jgi:RNA polymerase sigma-70 factor, ECF subfamily